MMLNEILLEQVNKHKVSTENLPENMNNLLQAISDAYNGYEHDHQTLKQAVSLCSSEMMELNSKLRKESKELKTLFETMREVFFSVDMETNQLIQISKACETVYGYLIDDFMKNPNLWAELVVAKDKHIVERIISKISVGLPFTFSYRICRKDGCIRWLETKMTPTLNDQNKVTRIDGFTSDITVRKEALHLLFESEQKLTTMAQDYLGAKILDHKD